MNVDIWCEILNSEFGKAIELSQFPSGMEIADVPPVYKKIVNQLRITITL